MFCNFLWVEVTHLTFCLDFVAKKGPLSNVNSVVLNEAQLTKNKQAGFCWSTQQICLTWRPTVLHSLAPTQTLLNQGLQDSLKNNSGRCTALARLPEIFQPIPEEHDSGVFD